VDRFPEHLREHFHAPRHVGEPPGGADLRGEARNPACGDHLVVFLKLSPETDGPRRVTAAGFLAQGCPAAMATGSAACEVMVGLEAGRALPQAIEQRFEAAFGSPAAAHRHALALVASAVQAALGDDPGY
jgi:NifU-like protein involved in Fe-S cluster formation